MTHLLTMLAFDVGFFVLGLSFGYASGYRRGVGKLRRTLRRAGSRFWDEL